MMSLPLRRMSLAAMLLCVPIAALLIPGCGQDEESILQPPDTTPPALTSLRIDAVGPDSVAFSWRAPGDDGLLGDARRYDLRYSTAPFSVDTWDDATAIPGLSAPQPARSMERVTVKNLTPSHTYYFALRSMDDASNWSPASPIVDLTTPADQGYPVLWGTRMFPETGTTQTAFVYGVRLRLDHGSIPAEPPRVVVGEVAHAMHFVSSEAGNANYEFALRLPAGAHDYYFLITDAAGRSTQLPSPGTRSGPAVDDCTCFVEDFVAAPVDTFLMGNPVAGATRDERPAHHVILTKPFYVDRYEITNGQYCRALNWAHDQGLLRISADTLVYSARSNVLLLATAPGFRESTHGIRYARETGFTPIPFRENWPVTHVTWFGAALYCNIRSWQEGLAPAYDEAAGWRCGPSYQPSLAEGWRLPMEAEWEYVAQYNDQRLYPTGSTPPVPGTEANYGNAVGHPARIGSYPEASNPLGIRDLAGNAWEWCNDWNDFYRLTLDGTGNEIPQVNPAGPRSGANRVARGGGWGSPAKELRCVQRFASYPAAEYDGLGFRCVRSMP